jgi:uncharacterized membrane protein
MTLLLLGLVLFLGSHLLTTQRAVRANLRVSFGENVFKGVYSLVALAGFALIVVGYGSYRADGYIDVWAPPRAMSHLALLLMLPVFVLLIAAYAPGGLIKRAVRHPMLAAVKFWALAHLLANGDLGSMLLFGGFLAWAVFARISLKGREAVEGAPDFSAMKFGRGDLIAIAGGLAAYGVFAFALHPLLIGVKVAGG